MVSCVSMSRGKQISPFKANHTVLEGTHWRQCAVGRGRGTGWPWQGEESYGATALGSIRPTIPGHGERGRDLLSPMHRKCVRRRGRRGTHGCFCLYFVLSFEMLVALPSLPARWQLPAWGRSAQAPRRLAGPLPAPAFGFKCLIHSPLQTCSQESPVPAHALGLVSFPVTEGF